MSRQDRDFPSLGGQLQENQPKQKKAQKQIGYDKNNSIQIQGMNDIVGFYYEGENNSQPQSSNQDSRGNRNNNNNSNNNNNNNYNYNNNDNNRNYEKQDNRRNQYNNQSQNTQSGKIQEKDFMSLNEVQQQQKQQIKQQDTQNNNTDSQYQRKDNRNQKVDTFDRNNQQSQYEVRQHNKNQTTQYEVSSKNNNLNDDKKYDNNNRNQQNKNSSNYVEKEQNNNQNQRNNQSTQNSNRGNYQNNSNNNNNNNNNNQQQYQQRNSQQEFQRILRKDVNEYEDGDDKDGEDYNRQNQRGNQQQNRNKHQENSTNQNERNQQNNQNRDNQNTYVAKQTAQEHNEQRQNNNRNKQDQQQNQTQNDSKQSNQIVFVEKQDHHVLTPSQNYSQNTNDNNSNRQNDNSNKQNNNSFKQNDNQNQQNQNKQNENQQNQRGKQRNAKEVFVPKQQTDQQSSNDNYVPKFQPTQQASNDKTQYVPKNQQQQSNNNQSQNKNQEYVQRDEQQTQNYQQKQENNAKNQNTKNQIQYEEYVPKQQQQQQQQQVEYVPKQQQQQNQIISKQQQQTDYVPKQQQNQNRQQNDQYIPKQQQNQNRQQNDQYIPKSQTQQKQNYQQGDNKDNNNNQNQNQRKDNWQKKEEQNNNNKNTNQGKQQQQFSERSNTQQNVNEENQQGNRRNPKERGNNQDNRQNERQEQEGKNSQKKGKTGRQKEQEKQEVSNEWCSDSKKYINQDQVFYMGEDKYYHHTQNKFQGQKRGIQKVLMVAEKPSIAKSIAEALSNGASRSVKGYSKYLPVHEFEGTFKGNRVIFRVTSVAGHVYGLDFPKECENWNKVNPVNLFSAKTLKVESNPSQSVNKHLEIEAQDSSYLLLWLDNDREGENICFEVKSICERVMCSEGNQTQQILRAKFSSLTKPDLIQAFKNIRDPPNMNESKAVDARQIIDLKIGAAFTRYQTLFFRNRYPELNESIISFGPCQTPTLGFCVQREDEIKNFKPRLYFRIRVAYLTEDKREIVSYYDKGHIFDSGDANKIHKEIVNSQSVTIDSVISDNGVKQRPEGLNTVQLLKIASSYLHLSPMETMHIAEKLYLDGYITYPRTESSAYPKTFQFDEILKSLEIDSDYGKYASELMKENYIKPRQGVDMGDHPPITPTTNYPSSLSGDQRKIYDYIARHFIASLSEDCKYKKIAITSKVQGYTFVARGIQMVKKGFMEVQDSVSLGENTISSNLKSGDSLLITSTNLEQEFTTPPGFITESELIGLMEKNSIGTDASMATHIQNICNRNYVQINGSNRSLVPTELGRSLIHGYQSIDPELVQPQIRAKIENMVDQIAKGSKEFSDVINDSMRIFQAKYLTFVENISKMDILFGSFCTTFEDTLETAKPFSKCGACNRFMKIIEKAGKLICEKCEISLSIPTNGKYKLAGEKKCPYDKYQVIFFTSQHTPNVSFEVCPKCYTESPNMDSDQVTCSICTNDACKLSMNSRFLKECFICKVGDIVIEPSVAQKLAAMCNECWTQWSLPIQTKDLKVNKEKKCDKCLSQVISFKHIVQQIKVEGNEKEQKEKYQKIIKFSQEDFVDVCLFCNPELQKECHQVEYHESRKRRFQRRKGRQ